MRGVIIAGGTGSRLFPLTKTINKNILAIYDKPLIYYPILSLRDAGIKEILIVTGKGQAGQFLDQLGSGSSMGVHLYYEVQEKPGGIAQAVGLAEWFTEKNSFAVILGDNIFEARFGEAVKSFVSRKQGASVFLKRVANPRRYGVAEVANNKIVKIVEKPEVPVSDLAVTGLYMYDRRAFDIIRDLQPSGRGELEISELNDFYAREGSLSYEILEGEWIDAGTFDSLLQANIFIKENKERLPQFQFDEKYQRSKS